MAADAAMVTLVVAEEAVALVAATVAEIVAAVRAHCAYRCGQLCLGGLCLGMTVSWHAAAGQAALCLASVLFLCAGFNASLVPPRGERQLPLPATGSKTSNCLLLH